MWGTLLQHSDCVHAFVSTPKGVALARIFQSCINDVSFSSTYLLRPHGMGEVRVRVMLMLRSRSLGLIQRVREVRGRILRVDPLPCEALLQIRGYSFFDALPLKKLVEMCTTAAGGQGQTQDLPGEVTEQGTGQGTGQDTVQDTEWRTQWICRAEELKRDDELFRRLVRQGLEELTRKMIIALLVCEDIRRLIHQQYDEDDDETGKAKDILDTTYASARDLLWELIERRNDIAEQTHVGDPGKVVSREYTRRQLEVFLLNRLRDTGTL